MKNVKTYLIIIMALILISCVNKLCETNGETIYKTGRNLQGEKLLNKKESRIKFVHNCKTCHGKSGDKMNTVSIRFSYLSNSKNFTVLYTDSLFFRFLDQDLKNNGTKANIGVIWRMNEQDKKDLLAYLKTL
jgi:cytochrome c553